MTPMKPKKGADVGQFSVDERSAESMVPLVSLVVGRGAWLVELGGGGAAFDWVIVCLTGVLYIKEPFQPNGALGPGGSSNAPAMQHGAADREW